MDCHELSVKLQCSSKTMNDFMSRIYFTKIKFLLQKIVLKLLLKKHTLKSDTISGN